MSEKADHEGAFRELVPVNRLASEVIRRLWQATTVKRYAADQLITARGTSDDLIHYLIDGEIDLFDHSRMV
ncbi:MAG: hypothetical protein EXR86_10825 [Gammaproteobacteria bacterium]|nr:hypothetical protein [Gammaproteobacteria bacterium]